jgi:hypothetical protein
MFRHLLVHEMSHAYRIDELMPKKIGTMEAPLRQALPEPAEAAAGELSAGPDWGQGFPTL